MKSSTAKQSLQAYEIMTKPVETVCTQDSIHDIATLFTEKNISAAAVLDTNNNPVGMITKTDIVRYEKERNGNVTMNKKDLPRMGNEPERAGFHLADDDETVENWMNPIIFNVKKETPLRELARRMVKYGLHHIFVKGNKNQPIIGIVSSFDVLRQVAAGLCDEHVDQKPR